MDTSQVPNLPGYSVSTPTIPPKGGFGRSQSLHYNNGYAIERPFTCGDGVDDNAERSVVATQKQRTSDGTVKLPKWVEMDRKVLRFYGYFVESVNESPIEDHRIRKVTIYYYLSDDTIHVEEPKQDNSGLTQARNPPSIELQKEIPGQGIFVKRHRIKKADGKHVHLTDLHIGDELFIYGRCIHVVDCDFFTRDYLQENVNYVVPGGIPYPIDPIVEHREKSKKIDASIPPNPRNDSLTRYLEAKLGKPSNVLEKDTLRKYLANNRMVLRFWCVWDDRDNLYGQRRPYALHYFLEDDTGEILECLEENSGRDPFPVFQKRGPLIKGCGVSSLGETTKYMRTYEPQDFRVGCSFRQNNREFFIYDCDDFTKKWYKNTLGTSEEELEQINIVENHRTHVGPLLPPHNGFGSREDSKQNCVMLIPKPPKKDFLKLMNKDSIVLRFSAAQCPTKRFEPRKEDIERTFVVTYFMADDTIAIFERPLKNSGVPGGKFLERAKIHKPDSDEPYTYHDLYVGAKLDIHRRGFILLDADDYTYTYMENNKHVFPVADVDVAISDLKQQVVGRESEIKEKITAVSEDGHLCLNQLGEALEGAGLSLVGHQIIALKRHFTKDNNSTVEVETFLKTVNAVE